ncbi:MAG: N-acetyl-gamma-glutamyl-phosphate reductase [Desulfobacteraceae bacterium]
MIRAGIVGATGYAGAMLVRLLHCHPEVELVEITSNSYHGTPISDIFPDLRQRVDMVCQKLDIDRLSESVDTVFLALPHKVSMAHAPGFLKNNVKVIDLSADFRFSDAAAYEAAYQPHTEKDLLKESVYGLSEIYTEEIRNAGLIGNPGCYPTSLLLPMIPLAREGILNGTHIVSDSKSGVSGAGRSASLTTHFCEANESFKPYKVEGHRHTPEMEEVLSLQGEQKFRVTFVPHLLPLTTGMLTTAYIRVRDGIKETGIREILENFYRGKPFIRILPEGRFPDTLHVKGSNFCDIGFHLEKKSGMLIMASAIDNLIKGASGQAIQNMNLMHGVDEQAGLSSL